MYLSELAVKCECGGVVGSAGLEAAEKRRVLSGTPGRAPLIMDRSLRLSCQVLCTPD